MATSGVKDDACAITLGYWMFALQRLLGAGLPYV
jgi:hypothetical protein